MKKGEKYIIEIEEVHTHVDDNGKKFPLARIKGFSSLVFDQKGLEKLEKFGDNAPTKDEPKPLNCRFVVKKTDMKEFTVGKIYEVKDGLFADDDNDVFPINSKLHSFEQLEGYLNIGSSKCSLKYGGVTEILEIKE